MKKTFKAFVLMTFTLLIAAITVFGASASAPIPGDVNGDGRVTVADSVAILLYITGKNTNIAKPCYHKGTVVIDEAVERTCTVDGKSAGVHCTACGEVLLEQESLTAQGHTESDWIIDRKPVGSEDGLKHTECTVCGKKIKEEAIPGVVIEGLAYTVNADGTTCTITGIGTYQGNDVIIPTKIDGYTVTAIGDRAFADQTQITSFFIPNTVKSIGTRAFYGCTGITEITIPESVTSIGTQIFYKASNLKTVYYNSSYGSNTNPFLNIPSIETLVFGGEQVAWSILLNNSFVKNVIMTNSVETINESAFEGCTNLTQVEFGNNIIMIDRSAFFNCTNLNNITLPESIVWVWTNAFAGCVNLTNITIPNSVTSIGNSAFSGCSSLTSINIPDSVTSIGDYAFYGCSSLTSISIPDSVTSIGERVFSGCSSLTSISIPDSVTSIGVCAFCGCSSLISISIPDSVTSIGGSAFSNCSSLTSISIPDSVTSIGVQAFSGCSSLISISIPDSVTSIGEWALSGCSSLTSINIPDSVTSMGWAAFYGCSSLTSISIPDSVTSIGGPAFYGCSSLTSISIPDSVTSIGDSAFDGCSSLISISIPDGVTSIGVYAFKGCSSLANVTFKGTIAQWESISKNQYWKDSSAIIFIQCTDGYIMSGNDNISSTVPIHEHVFNKQYSFDGKSALFFGDSITYGWVDSTVGKTSKPYPQLFSEKVGLTHTNYGVSGATLGCTVPGRSNILDIIKSKELNTDYLFIAGGVNDWAIGTPLNTFKEGVENLCSYLASNYQGEVIFITPIDQAGYPLGNVPVAELQKYRDIITILAVKYGFNVVQGNLLGFPDESGDPSLISSLFADKLHPTEYGYQFYAVQLTKAFGIE